jgi:predicted PurR-regulated permease PerM
MAQSGGRNHIVTHGGPTLDLFGGRGRLLALLAAAAFIVWLARDVLGPFIVAAVLAYAFSPIVSTVEDRTRLPRALVIVIGYIVVIGGLVILAIVAAERAGSELSNLTSGGPDVIATALQKIFGDQIVIAGTTYQTADIAAQMRSALLGLFRTPSDALHVAEEFVNFGLRALLALIVTFYFLLDGGRMGRFGLRFLEPAHQEDALRIGHRIHLVLGRWLRGQMFLIALVSLVLYIILGPVLHIPYALALAILSGVLEIIPLIGPIIAATLAATVAFATHGADTAIVVIVVYTIVRLVEDQIVMPLVIGRAVHLHPVVTIFAVLVGVSAYGILGGLLAVPVAAALNVTLHELYPGETAAGREEGSVPKRLRPGRASVERRAAEPAAGERGIQARPAGGQARRAAVRTSTTEAPADAPSPETRAEAAADQPVPSMPSAESQEASASPANPDDPAGRDNPGPGNRGPENPGPPEAR